MALKHTGSIFAAAIAIALGAPAADAQSLLANGFFDGSTNGWTGSYGAYAYQGNVDADHDTRSGSGQVINLAPEDSHNSALQQCIAVSPGMTYFAGASIRFDPGQVGDGNAQLGVAFADQPGCNGNYTSLHFGGNAIASSDRGKWVRSEIGDVTSGIVADAGAKSALVYVVLHKNVGGGYLSASVDNVTFAPIGVHLCRGLAATILGTDGPDTLIGTPGPDVIVGLGGNDTIHGKGGDDVICGGTGKDSLYGEGGDDWLNGGAGNDFLKGGSGNDVLIGGSGDDSLYGGPGDDVLAAGAGWDACFPGADDDPGEAICEPILVYP
ncbi:MAG TPA: calcium-binding protein [Candidatus Binatia bacterium]|nr:calcium-binding protein [Candidatus Binatia bacterium]